MNKTEKAHKYNVGDVLTVKIAAVHEVNGKPVYRLKGIENVGISQKALDKMRQDRFMQGEKAYAVHNWEEEGIIILDTVTLEDVGTKEIKIGGEWRPFSESELFKEQGLAEQRAVELAVKYGCRIVKDGHLKQEADNAGRN